LMELNISTTAKASRCSLLFTLDVTIINLTLF